MEENYKQDSNDDQNDDGFRHSFSLYQRRIFSIGFPFASSSTNLSNCRIFFISGSSMVSTWIPQIL